MGSNTSIFLLKSPFVSLSLDLVIMGTEVVEILTETHTTRLNLLKILLVFFLLWFSFIIKILFPVSVSFFKDSVRYSSQKIFSFFLKPSSYSTLYPTSFISVLFNSRYLRLFHQTRLHFL